MKILLTFAIGILLSGCVSLPANEQELKVSGNQKVLCSKLSPQETYDLLIQKMRVCYSANTDLVVPAGSSFMSIKNNTYIEYRPIENNAYVISISMQGGLAPRMYGELVEISDGSEACRTKLDIHLMNSFWNKSANRVEAWINGKEANCFW